MCGKATDPTETENPDVISGRFDCLNTENQQMKETAPTKSPDPSSQDPSSQDTSSPDPSSPDPSSPDPSSPGN